MSPVRRFASLRVDGVLYGLEVGHVEEVLPDTALTRLPLAAPAVRGIMNLRGRIVTVLDLRRCFGLAERPAGRPPVKLVLRTADNPLGLLADEVGDVIEVEDARFAPRPEHARGPGHELVAGVYRLDSELLRVLDVDRLRAHAEA